MGVPDIPHEDERRPVGQLHGLADLVPDRPLATQAEVHGAQEPVVPEHEDHGVGVAVGEEARLGLLLHQPFRPPPEVRKVGGCHDRRLAARTLWQRSGAIGGGECQRGQVDLRGIADAGVEGEAGGVRGDGGFVDGGATRGPGGAPARRTADGERLLDLQGRAPAARGDNRCV